MTSEYDELLALLDGLAGMDRAQVPEKAAAAIRALTAQGVERDTVIEQVRKWNRNARLPIAEDCDRLDTILNQAPRDALAARDAVRDKTVRADAFDEGWDACRYGLADPQAPRQIAYVNPHRTRADQEEL